jgi:hypothetical protein
MKMELVKVNNNKPIAVEDVLPVQETSGIHFMAANTSTIMLEELQQKHTIPVFAKDNESTISHQEFIETVSYVADHVFKGEVILKPAVRVSHPIKGRIPSAVGKPAKELQDHEKTLYYERMAFVMEIPSITTDLAGNSLNLAIGGVRAYNLENLYSRKSEECFKLFIGFQNRICTNLCISTDGFKADVKARSIAELAKAVYDLLGDFNVFKELEKYNRLPDTFITESQFAQIIGRARLYQNMPIKDRRELPSFPLLDSQVNLVVKDYYSDESFSRDENGNINLWKLFNLFTGANKMSYIDNFLDRNVECQHFINGIQLAMAGSGGHWFIN